MRKRMSLGRIAKIALDESGMTTVTVIAIISLIIALMTASILTVQSDRVGIVHRISRDRAVAVAEGGLNDYLWRLNKDHEYYLNYTHPAQGNDQSGQPNYVAFGNGEYHLTITPPSDSVPMVTVKSTARIKTASGAYLQRSITAQVRMRKFTDYIFMTDYEVVEGSNDIIWWKTGDVVDGPLHTNDNLNTSGTPWFKSEVTMTGILNATSGTPRFDAGYVEHSDDLTLPPTNTKIKDFATQGGYYYYGVTTIYLDGSSLNITNNDASGKTTGPTGNVSFPSNGVIYVDGLASAKYTAGNGDVYIRGTYQGKLTIGAKNIIYVTGDIRYMSASTDVLGLVADNYVYVNHYSQSAGDVTLAGTLHAMANSTFQSGTIVKAGAVATNSADTTGLGGTWTSTYVLSADRTLPSTPDVTLLGQVDALAGTKLKGSSLVKSGSIAMSATDKTNIGGTWTGTGPYTLSADITLPSATDVTLAGTVNLAIGSKFKGSSIIKSGSTATSATDRTNLGGTWNASSPYTLSADRTTTSVRTLQGTLDVTGATRIRTNSLLRTNTTCVNINDVYALGGNWTVTVPYTLQADRTLDGDVAPFNIEIDAAIAAVNHSFGFERYAEGSPKGVLTIKGSLTQKYRGPVGTFSGSTNVTGYSKNYSFDPRMVYLAPPHFIEPENSGFEIVTWNEGP
jgi:hypothetical protein